MDEKTKSKFAGAKGKPMPTRALVHAALLAVFAALSAVMYSLIRGGIVLAQISPSSTLSRFLMWVFVGGAVYEVVALLVHAAVRLRRGSDGEVRMLTDFYRMLAVIGVVLFLLSCTGTLKQLGAVMGAFAGMLLGWSLQAPVSGMAAWVLITLKRPFRVGDRVLFPSLGLSGDVLEVGLMYTKLDQVGGSISSEDAIGRYILIPNAMLFGQVAINYTPQPQSAYFLDEVVIRLTYDSDWATAEKILLTTAREVTSEIIAATGREPYIRSDLYDYGVYVRLRYMTLAMDRPSISHAIVSRIFREFQSNPRVDFAIPFVYSYRHGSESGGHAAGGSDALLQLPLDQIDDPQAKEPLSAEDRRGVEDLAERFKNTRLIQPLAVRLTGGGRYELVSGRFRYLAVRQLGWTLVPATLRPALTAAESISSSADSVLAPPGVQAPHGAPPGAPPGTMPGAPAAG